VHWAPGIPHALFGRRDDRNPAASVAWDGRSMAEVGLQSLIASDARPDACAAPPRASAGDAAIAVEGACVAEGSVGVERVVDRMLVMGVARRRAALADTVQVSAAFYAFAANCAVAETDAGGCGSRQSDEQDGEKKDGEECFHIGKLCQELREKASPDGIRVVSVCVSTQLICSDR